MQLPIIVAVGHDVQLFASVADATRYLEPRDVAAGVYRAWDASGRALRVDLGDAVCLELAPVILTAADSGDESQAALSETLRTFLSATGQTPVANATLRDLIALAQETAGFSR
jgi:hypothetical protein